MLTNAEENRVQQLINFFDIIPFNQLIKEQAILFRKQYKLKLADSIIAASASIHQLPLVTADTKLENIQELEIVLYRV